MMSWGGYLSLNSLLARTAMAMAVSAISAWVHL